MTPDKCEHDGKEILDAFVLECDKCGEAFIADPAKGQALYLSLRPGTGDEPCGGEPHQHDIKCGLDLVQFCVECGARFVPETLLREARRALALTLGSPAYDNGLYDGTDRTVRDVAKPVLDRIDAVLGGPKP